MKILEKYVNFRLWLTGNRELSEENYEDEHIKEYESYLEDLKVKQQKDQEDSKKYYEKLNEERREIDRSDRAFEDWKAEKYSSEEEYGRGSRVDEHGAVFNDDGEWIGME